MKNKKSSDSKKIRTLRKTARITAVSLIVLTLAFAFVYIFFPEDYNPNAEPNPNEIYLISLGVLIIVGLGLAWKWELIGGLISLAGYIGVVILNPDTMTMPLFYLFPLTAILFLVCWFLSKSQRRKEEAVI